jgi:hypothetical protein
MRGCLWATKVSLKEAVARGQSKAHLGKAIVNVRAQ